MNEDRYVYARRQMEGAEWFPLHITYNPNNHEMYRAIAEGLADGAPDEDMFDLAHAPWDEEPNVPEGTKEGDWFDMAWADSSFDDVRVGFEVYNAEFHL